ncbi:uncharacterized protein VTP21DRAFT_3366 [Calcarisporiella thermophila]|uniref:uncharacterized protein n=1 Tax=Calcarisporiella thermophila TaxID=911321 RepID=UPI003743670D
MNTTDMEVTPNTDPAQLYRYIMQLKEAYDLLKAKVKENEKPTPTPPPPAPEPKPTLQPGKPDYFHGNYGEDVDSWIASIRRFLQLYKLPPQDELFYAISYLKGNALAWWNTYERRAKFNQELMPTTFDHLAQLLHAHFKPIGSEVIARERLDRLRQTGSVQEYAYAFQTIINDIPEINSETLQCFIRGLKPNTQAEVKIRQPKSLEEAINLTANIFDQVKYPSFHRNPSSSPMHQKTSHVPFDPATPMEIDGVQTQRLKKLTPEERNRLIQMGACLRCRKMGKNQLPVKNGVSAGTREVSTQTIDLTEVIESPTEIPCLQIDSPGSKFSLLRYHGTIKSCPILVFVDGRAAGGFISLNEVHKLNLKTMTISPILLKFANGNTHVCNSLAKSVPVQVSDHKENLDLLVEDLPQYDIILGKPWLAGHQPFINWETNEIKFDFNNQKSKVNKAKNKVKFNNM